MTYNERESRLITVMENRTEYNDGLTPAQLCNEILGYEIQVLNDKEKMNTLNSGLGTEEERNDIATKWFADKAKIRQITNMLPRVRHKYRAGSKYNDTNIHKHQYYLLPPRLQQEDRQWRCVHIIAGVNGHLINPLLMRRETYTSTLEKTIRIVERKSQFSDEERQESKDQHLDKRFAGKARKLLKKLIPSMKQEKRLPWRYKPDIDRTVLVYLEERNRFIQQYGFEMSHLIVNDDEMKRILTDILLADYEKRVYRPKDEWELLGSLKEKDKDKNA